MVKVASQWPAQANPVGDMFKTEVSLEEYVMGTARLVPPLVCADEMNEITPPRTRDVLPPGVRVILPGNSGVFFFPPPHPTMLPNIKIATAKRRLPERNLPMHPSSHRGPARTREPRQTLNELENL
jgi:hypothetical protein